jgi:hypothetical protein
MDDMRVFRPAGKKENLHLYGEGLANGFKTAPAAGI